MKDILSNLDPLWQSFILSTIFTYGCTALGAGLVFFVKKANNTFYSFMLAFSAGIMFSASLFSLLVPAFHCFNEVQTKDWVGPLTFSFISGAILFYFIDIICCAIEETRSGCKPCLCKLVGRGLAKKEKSPLRRAFLLAGALTLHNIPEGMSVGVATANGVSQGLTISIGLGLHNITEGLAVSVPLLAAGLNPWVSFFLGQLSGIVYPLTSVLSTYFTLANTSFMPYMLAFAAGCMIFVSVEDLLPNAYEKQNRISASLPFLVGFVLMMWFEYMLD